MSQLSRHPNAVKSRLRRLRLRRAVLTALGGENPFLQGLVQTTLALAWQETQKPQEVREPGGLLTLPGDSPLIRR